MTPEKPNERSWAGNARSNKNGHTLTDAQPTSDPADQTGDGLEEAWEGADWWWRDCAERALLVLAESGQEFTAYDLSEMGVPDPDHPNRWGALFNYARRMEIIRPVRFEQSRRRSRHGGVCRVWRGVPKRIGGEAA